MNITLPILLLVFGGLTFWILNESKLQWYIRTALIASFCSFTILFYTLIHTFLGWAAEQNDIPEKISIHWVIIKEPNKILDYEFLCWYMEHYYQLSIKNDYTIHILDENISMKQLNKNKFVNIVEDKDETYVISE